MKRTFFRSLSAAALLLTPLVSSAADAGQAGTWVPALSPIENPSPSELAGVVARFTSDREALSRHFDAPHSPDRLAALRAFTKAWQAQLETIDFESLGVEGRIDWILLATRLRHDQRLLDREEKRLTEAAPLLPFAPAILGLADARRRLDTMDPKEAAKTLADVSGQIEKTRQAVEAGLPSEPGREKTPTAGAPAATPQAPIRTSKIVAYRSAAMARELKTTLASWFHYSDGYDPLFSWWCEAPYRKADAELEKYVKFLRERVVGWKEGDDEPIVGDPIGREAILQDLADELIAYTPEELVAIAEREFAWCENEMKKASREMGYGDDWKKALEKVKTLHVDPGRQADLVRDIHREAVEFIRAHDLVTVPPLADVVWRMEMMSPERQKVNPFFLGGEEMLVSFPTDGMSEEDKLMSMRGNNIHFSRATVFHEEIPGHHLQGFMEERYNPHRNAFATPFLIEGWALHWEMVFWDLGFAKTPENRVGMLFWRMHRCARIIFSLGFHLGKMTPQQCIDFLVDRVGHERANATAEVRRSFNGDYSPLYQLAYMMGALQFRALQKELVDSGQMGMRPFHDAILKAGDMPVAMIRASIEKEKLLKDYKANWRFEGDPPPAAPVKR
ncbi:MAG TPA: DUF885 family protein [Thermoanaerobaculia bacterium]|jgi:uncharacterized protein (DUF885 family)